MALTSKVRTRVRVKATDRDKARGRDKIKTSSNKCAETKGSDAESE